MGYRYHGQIGANLILGGVDCTGNHLYTVGPYGSVNTMPYLAMGMWHNTVLQALFFDYLLVEFEFLWRYSVSLFCRKWNGWFSVLEFPKINYVIYSLTSSSLFHLTLNLLCAGSGDLAALGILEDGFKPGMEVHEPPVILSSSIAK